MITISNCPLLEIRLARSAKLVISRETQDLVFQASAEYPNIIEIEAEVNGNREMVSRILYSTLGHTEILTIHSNSDYNGPIIPKTELDRKKDVKDMKIEHLSDLHRLEERHLEKISNERSYAGRDVAEKAAHAYSRLANSLAQTI